MNNKGFSLIELLFAISLVSIMMVILISNINNTFGLSSEKSYEILKKSIITQVNEYIYECDNELINCEEDYVWKKTKDEEVTSFKLNVMKKYSYFNEFDYINPITNQEIGECLIINVIKDKYSTLDVSLDDSKCEK